MTEQIAEFPKGFDPRAQVLNLKDEPLKGEEGKPFLVGDFIINALLGQLESDKALDGKQKLNLWKLAQIVQKAQTSGKHVRLNSKQKSLILDRAEKLYTTLIYARLYEAIEGVIEDE